MSMLGVFVLTAPLLVLAGYFFVQGARSSRTQRALSHVLLFLAAGPLLLPALVLLVGLASGLAEPRPPGIWEVIFMPMGALSGAWVWWGHGLTGGWMATIGPTALAGVLTWAALEVINNRQANATEPKRRQRWVRIAVSAIASAAAFSIFSAFVSEEQARPGFDLFWPAIGYVAVVGAAVGAMIKGRSVNDA